MKKSNRSLAKLLNRLRILDFSRYNKGFFNQIKILNRMPYDIFDLEPTSTNFVYRAVINNVDSHYEKISRIAFNPNPQYISRANLKGQTAAYYASSYDVAIMEACHEKLKMTDKRIFEITVSKWKIKKEISVLINCNSTITQGAGTDLKLYYERCKSKRKSMLPKKDYRTWYLKTKFMTEQFAKEVSNEIDYYISARFSNQILNKTEIKGIVYPSIRYLFKGFNIAFSPQLFKDNSLLLEEVAEYKVSFDNVDKTKYPIIVKLRSTTHFSGDNILW